MNTEKQSNGTGNSNKKQGASPLPRARLRWGGVACLLAWLSLVVCSFGQTITWQENWESPAAQDNWYADNGYWEIGVPTSGPPTNSLGWRAHQGTNVAATVLNGNYTDDRQSRLISSPIPVPAANLIPRLRFWHWWSFACGDYGQMQISTNNGVSWINLSGQYSADSSIRWSRGWLDLTPYAGKTVRLGLYFYSTSAGCNNTVAEGWYVDEMVIENGVEPPFNPSESFETGWEGWRADYIGGKATDFAIWEIGVPTSGPGATHSGGGTNCAATVLGGDYPENRSSRLVSQPFVVTNDNPRLRFWHWWRFACGDYGQVQISTNNGASWINLSGQYWADSSSRWSRGWLDLTPYSGRTVRLGLYFYSTDAGCNNTVEDGWYVDEIAIENGPEQRFNPLESFETGWGGWKADYFGGKATDFAIWEIGVPCPASGPGAAHGGTNCAATVLCGNYPEDRSSRLVSPPFVVPPAETNPRLRFWHWWIFACGDYGQVQISTNNGASWITLAGYSTSSPWTRPQLGLIPFAGQTVRLGFYFYATSSGCNYTVAPGWYIDEVRLLHDPALLLIGSPVVRTQDTACVSLAIAVDSPSSGASFVIEAPAGNLNGPLLSTDGCWSSTIIPQSATQWLVNMLSSCTAGSAGVETIGTICFSAVSPHSAFVPLTVNSLVISNLAPAHAFGTRVVNIANEPLLEGWLDSSKKRMVTTYGKANTGYVIHQSTNATAVRPWPLGWTNTVPASLFTNSPVRGSLSNAPVLFLNARQQ
jgi:hypothetical protein